MLKARLPGPQITLATPFLYLPIHEESGNAIRNYGNVGPQYFLLENNTGRAWDNEPKYSINRIYSVGCFVRPTIANGYRYECTAVTTGLSHATINSSGSWSTTLGVAIVDSGVTWTCRALDNVSGAVHGSGAESVPTAADNPADYIHPNDASQDVAGGDIFELCNFWRNADGTNTGKRLFIRFRVRTHAMFDQDEIRIPNSAYQMSGSIISFGGGDSNSPTWNLTINSDVLYKGLNYVDSIFIGDPIFGYGTSGSAHQSITGNLLTCDNGTHEVCCYFDAIDGDLRTWVDGVESVINADTKRLVIEVITGYASSSAIPPFYFSESGNFSNGLTLMSRNSSNVPGARAAQISVTGATAGVCNEFLLIQVINPLALNQCVADLYKSPRCALPGSLVNL